MNNQVDSHKQQASTGGYLGDPRIAKEVQPTEPTTLGRGTELLNHVATAERHSASLKSALFGLGDSDGPRAEPTTLDGILAAACERVASLCGELATIKTRLGCSPE